MFLKKVSFVKKDHLEDFSKYLYLAWNRKTPETLRLERFGWNSGLLKFQVWFLRLFPWKIYRSSKRSLRLIFNFHRPISWASICIVFCRYPQRNLRDTKLSNSIIEVTNSRPWYNDTKFGKLTSEIVSVKDTEYCNIYIENYRQYNHNLLVDFFQILNVTIIAWKRSSHRVLHVYHTN